MLTMNRAWYARAQMTRTLMRYLGSHCKYTTTQFTMRSERGRDTHARVAIEDVDVVSGVEVVDRAFTVNFERVYANPSAQSMLEHMTF